MSPTVGVGFSAAADGRELKIDSDCVLVSVVIGSSAAGVKGVVSRDPKATIANTITSPSNSADENLITVAITGTESVLSVPLSAGQSVFASASAACQVIYNFQLIA